MMFPGMMLAGAQSRLLPVDVPYRWFVTAALFQPLAWAMVLAAPGALLDFAGGMGPQLAAVHGITLGVLVATALGAATQLLSVAGGQGVPRIGLSRWGHGLFVPGLLVLLAGYFFYQPMLMAAGAVVVALGIALALVPFAGVVKGAARPLPLIARHAWVAMGCLGLVVVLALALADDYGRAWMPDHPAVAASHFVLAAFGFMGFLALGFSRVLVPMFALSQAADEQRGAIAFWLAVVGLGAAVGGLLIGSSLVVAIAALFGLAASGFHIRDMLGCLQSGMRKRLGTSFVMVRAAWAFLVLGLVLGLITATNDWAAGPVVFGFVVLVGWLLTFVTGILQRIVPFLASMHVAKAGGVPPRPSELGPELFLNVHAGCHLAAFVLVGGGLAFSQTLAVGGGALIGLAGGLAYLGYVGTAVVRLRKLTPKSETPSP